MRLVDRERRSGRYVQMQQSGSVDLDATFFPEEVDCCGMAIDFSCLRAFAL